MLWSLPAQGRAIDVLAEQALSYDLGYCHASRTALNEICVDVIDYFELIQIVHFLHLKTN